MSCRVLGLARCHIRKLMQVQVVDQTTHPPICCSFVGLDKQIGSSPPAEVMKSKTRRAEVLHLFRCVTHTHTNTHTHTHPHTPQKSSKVFSWVQGNILQKHFPTCGPIYITSFCLEHLLISVPCLRFMDPYLSIDIPISSDCLVGKASLFVAPAQ